MKIKVLKIRDFDIDETTQPFFRELEECYRKEAKKKGYHFIKYRVGTVVFWVCTLCGDRALSEVDAKWHVKAHMMRPLWTSVNWSC